jgi:hypothetical protein
MVCGLLRRVSEGDKYLGRESRGYQEKCNRFLFPHLIPNHLCFLFFSVAFLSCSSAIPYLPELVDYTERPDSWGQRGEEG